jgi:hypothetical protein
MSFHALLELSSYLQVVSDTSREILKAFRSDFQDLSARIGATSFGKAEDIDMTKFQGLVYVNESFACARFLFSCCTPETERFVPGNN